MPADDEDVSEDARYRPRAAAPGVPRRIGYALRAIGRVLRRPFRRRSSGQYLRLALHLANINTFVWDVRTGEVWWWHEPYSIDQAGSTAVRSTFEQFIDQVDQDDRDRVREVLDRSVHEASPFEVEFRLVYPGERNRWCKAAGQVLDQHRGRATRVIGISQDLTEFKEFDDRLQKAEGRYRTMVEQLPLVSYLENLDEESAAYISPQIAGLLGYTAEEWIADPTFFANALYDDDRDRVLAGFASMHETGEPLDCEYRLIARDGRVIWIHDAAVVVRDEHGTPRYTQGYMIDISERKRSEEALTRSQERLREQMAKAEHQALHDGLTGLPNRMLFQDRVAQAVLRSQRKGDGFAVMLIDLDRFKEVNDTLGHHSGDQLLQQIASRLAGALRRSDTAARLGGDEFALLIPQLTDADEAKALADTLRAVLVRPMTVGGLIVEVEASVGIALYPQHGSDVETLVRRADVSMYVSKNSHTPVVYTGEYDHDALDRLVLVGELRQALQTDELVVYYQPQAGIASGQIHKVEALVRWQHPDRGLLGPDHFIPLAEQTGMIRALTRYVLDTALGQCRAWHDEGRSIGIAVNITGRELLDLGFPDEVSELLTKWDLDPTVLELEITETTIMTDLPRARSILGRLRDLGIRTAIDDFGSGHSSLGYLKHLPIDILKIDKSFVQNMATDLGDAAVVRTAIDLGRSLGLEVVAEGVETEQARQHLADLGCDTFQGYYLGRPQPGDRVFSHSAPVQDLLRH
jgi:diguanylate cyclase (GGDEF)-like protein/PAS domain S-box-containing protein